ncbi:MAG: AAA family ATPase [Calothrix sp. FI2-JRJ7]|jgi:hypothetical protein|nr:AAA family ATPase [Calothrix sp. FI2-JRJ7]
MTIQNQSQPKQNYSSAAKKPMLPILWVPSIIEAGDLFGRFELIQHSQASSITDIPTGVHYIYISPSTSEADVKNIIWHLNENKCICSVYCSETNLHDFLKHDSTILEEVVKTITSFDIPSEVWIEQRNNVRISEREARQIAKIAYLLPEDKKSAELATLRERCRCSSFDWNRYMESLESRFIKEVEKRTGVNPEEEWINNQIELLIQETDKTKAVLIKRELYKKGIGRADIKDLLDNRNAKEDKKLTIYSASEFEALNLTGVKYLIPGIVQYKGVTLFGGNTGIGKTRLAYDMAACVIYNEPFLDEKPNETGNVLFINSPSEMILDEVKEYFFDRGILGSGKYSVITDFTMHKLEALKTAINDGTLSNLKLIVADSLIGILKATDANLDENSDKAGIMITQLKQFSEEVGIPIVLLHHTSKDKEARGVNRFRGHSSIVGNSNCAWLLSGSPNSSHKHLTNEKSRSISTNKKVYVDNSGKWHLSEVNAEDSINKNTFDRVVEFMQTTDATKKYTQSEILKSIGCNQNTLKSALKYGVDRNYLNKEFCKKDNRCRFYWLVENNITPPSPNDSVVASTYPTESVDTQAFENTLTIGCNKVEDRVTLNEQPNNQIFEGIATQAFKLNTEIGCSNDTPIGRGANNNLDNQNTVYSNYENNLVNTLTNFSETLVPNSEPSEVPTQTIVAIQSKPLEAQISVKTPQTAPQDNNTASEASKQICDKTPKQPDKPKSININSRVVINDSDYGNEVYVVVGGDGRPMWTVQKEELAKQKKQSNADLIEINASKVIKLEPVGDGS